MQPMFPRSFYPQIDHSAEIKAKGKRDVGVAKIRMTTK